MGDIPITVTTSTKEIQFRFLAKRNAQALFQEVCRNLSIREVWYFGLYYFTADGEKFWIDQSNKKMSVHAAASKQLYFGIKYYPEDVGVDVIEAITRKYLYFETRNDILKDRLYCPADTCVLLASYAMQFKFGDFDESEDISHERLIPDRVANQHKLSKSEFLQSVTSMWAKHGGLLQDDTVMEYLKLTQNLDMIGVHYYDITNPKGTALVLGINPLGINVYKADDKINPTTQFPWAEIDHLHFRARKFIISMVDKKAKDMLFFCSDPKISKQILKLGVGYHQLYIRRRKPDTLDVQEMKEIAAQQRHVLEMQRDRLRRQQIKSQRLEDDYAEKLKNIHDELDATRNQLSDSLLTNQKLHKRLAELEAAKMQLEQGQQELKEMLQMLEDTKSHEEYERQRLLDEIDNKRAQVVQLQQHVHLKDEEAQRLQDEMDEAKRQYELLQAQQIAEHEQELLDLQRIAENESSVALKSRDELPELAEINQQLRDELTLLQDKLEQSRDDDMITPEDRIHRENLREGRDKYKTLSAIRRGNTNRRVEMFENY